VTDTQAVWLSLDAMCVKRRVLAWYEARNLALGHGTRRRLDEYLTGACHELRAHGVEVYA
jgi:hypothetical protein